MLATREIEQILDQLLSQPEEIDLPAFLARPEITTHLDWLIAQLVAKVDFYNRSEPSKSNSLADLILKIASSKDNPQWQGLAYRAKGHALRAIGRYQEALPNYSQAVSFFKQAGLAEEEGRTYLGELAALGMLGQHAECLRRGIFIRRRLARLNSPLNLAKLDINLGAVNFHAGRYQQAIRLQSRAIQLLETLNQTELIMTARLNRANSFSHLNRFRQATEDYEACRTFFIQANMSSMVAMVDTNLGFLLFNQARYNDALTLLVKAQELFEITGQPDKRAQAEIDLAYCYSGLGLSNAAQAFYEQASQTLIELGMRAESLRAEIGLAQVLVQKNELAQADIRLQTVLALCEAATERERNQPIMAMAWLYRAQLTLRGAISPSKNEALELARQAKILFGKLKLSDWYAQSLLVEAALLHQLQAWDEAEAAYLAALGPVKRLKLPHLLYQLHYGFGNLKQARLEVAPAAEKKALTQAAYQQYLKAAEQVETIRARLRPEEWRSAFMENGLGAYEALVALCLQDVENPQRLEEAFHFIERSKSRSLLDALAQNLLNLDEQSEAGASSQQRLLASQIETLRQELNWFYSRLHNPAGPANDSEGQRFLTTETDQMAQQVELRERELTRLIRRYNLDEPQANQLEEWSSTAAPSKLSYALIKQLQKGQSVLEYYVLNGQVIAFILNEKGIQSYYQLCSLAQITDLQTRLNYQANKFNLGRAYVMRRMETLRQTFELYLQQFYDLLIAPLINNLAGGKLIIVPHGSLHTLPFHAFYDGQHYLLEHFELSYAPSAGVLLHCLKQPERPLHKLLALGVPDEQLTGMEAEVRGLEPFFPSSRLLVGSAATMEGLRSNLGWCDVLHLASHGIFREDNPLFSMLKLADGWLSVNDICGWRFQPGLVTLSACQTGLNRPIRGDELLGLARGFLVAGACSLVVSLWSVNDEVTTELMQLFYKALVGGQSPSAALRSTMLKLLTHERYAHPHYWAPFVIIGRP